MARTPSPEGRDVIERAARTVQVQLMDPWATTPAETCLFC